MRNWKQPGVKAGLGQKRCRMKHSELPKREKGEGLRGSRGQVRRKARVFGIEPNKLWTEVKLSKAEIEKRLELTILKLKKSILSRRDLRLAIINTCIRYGHTRQEAMNIVDKHVRDDVPMGREISKPIWRED